jgi:hypothetical protein
VHYEAIVLIALFATIGLTIKTIVDARARTKLLQSNAPESLVHAILQREERRRQHSHLRWGIVILFLAAGFMAVELMNRNEVTPGVIAVLLAATGLGNIVSFFAGRMIENRERDDPKRVV